MEPLEEQITIQPATPADAPHIAHAVLEGVGPELVSRFVAHAGGTHNMWRNMFERLARRTDSQYSYLNALVARDNNGNTLGVIIAYDGARYMQLRTAFADEYHRQYHVMLPPPDQPETTPDEYYIDTLAVFAPYRGRGIAARLIQAAAARAHGIKPVGLLVDKTNHRARGLYRRQGFTPAGERPFGGELMDHLVL